MATTKKSKEVLGVYLKENDKKTLARLAEKNKRSMSAQAAMIIEEYLEELKTKPKAHLALS